MPGLPATEPQPVCVTELAAQALWQELMLTPKPGLVDRANNGAHRDMDYGCFTRSIAAITPWFSLFEELGETHAERVGPEQLQLLRPAGIACEQAMYAATGGVNTHKGGIFSLGLLCCAAGRLRGRREVLSADALCAEVSQLCAGLVARELAARPGKATAGERQYRQLGLAGARGEAESGFTTVRRYVLPAWENTSGEQRLQRALLQLMAVNPDSNLISRGGLAGLRYVQTYARQLLADGWDNKKLAEMDRQLIVRHLSPGGSADLLAVAWVLGNLGQAKGPP
ncbi:triphosphoribosyl-dephospho-CoA synthase CitG [Kalamiella sp. sgz302252]|uniref:triphosphoribosyl-dephospho-CoA synthase CitG n=1 Tax=Pantoea sp. sgz302252 TaxID=3341827 RepID=UPI0036D3725F